MWRWRHVNSLGVVIDQLLPQAQSLPGFKGVIFLLDEKGSKAIAITLYESEEVARVNSEARDRLRSEAVGEAGASISSVESYEVPAQVMAVFILALAAGFTLEGAANPGALPFEVLSQMVARAVGFTDRGVDTVLAAKVS
jgi:hypothetical protein